MARNQQTLVAAPTPGTAGIEFVCPACRATLGADHAGLRCPGCGAVHPVVNGQPDLRLRSPAPRSQTFLVGEVPVAPTVRPIRPTGPVHLTEALSGSVETLGNGLTPGLLDRIPVATRPDAVMLDIGCGGSDAPGAVAARVRGYRHLGLDFDGDGADALADAHALPLPDASVECAVSFSVLEHLSDPFEAAREVRRVLRPGALFVGTVAFLEPFHLDSYFHMSHLGIAQVLRRGGFELLELEANEEWLAHDALAAMQPRYGRLTQLRLHKTRHAQHAVRRLIRRVRPAHPDHTRNTTGGFGFVARRPFV